MVEMVTSDYIFSAVIKFDQSKVGEVPLGIAVENPVTGMR